MKKSGIYRIINTVNGNYYIGSAVDLRKREKEHFTSLSKNQHRNTHLQRSFNLHGNVPFIFDVIEYCEKEDLILREQFWINDYRARGEVLYNICLIAGSKFGVQHSEETKKRISEKIRGKPSRKKGIKVTAEVQKRMSMAQKRRVAEGRIGITDKSKQKLSILYKGIPRTEEVKKKISDGHNKRHYGMLPPPSKKEMKKENNARYRESHKEEIKKYRIDYRNKKKLLEGK